MDILELFLDAPKQAAEVVADSDDEQIEALIAEFKDSDAAGSKVALKALLRLLKD
jgi:hypothetical protein